MDGFESEVDKPAKKGGTTTKVFLFIGVILTLIAVGYFTLNIVSALSAVQRINQQFLPAEGEEIKPVEIAFLESRLQASRVDSASLVLDLSQGMATLEMAGVVVYRAPIENINVSPVIRRVQSASLAKMVGQPSKVLYWHSTADKEPITVRQAPASPEEAEATTFPQHGENEHGAFFSLDLESGIRLVFTHETERSFRKTRWLARERFNLMVQNLEKIFTGQIPEYTPVISVEVGAKDALVIFRALPSQGLVVINPDI